MTFRDWLRKTVDRFRHDDAASAAGRSARDFWRGVERRTGLHAGDPVWQWHDGDWDICIVLDACRVDLLAEVADDYAFLPSDIPRRRSLASCSADWIHRHCESVPVPWRKGMLTANPFSSHVAGWRQSPPDINQFGLTRELWRDRWREVQSIRTVPPSDMAAATVRTWRRRDEHGIDQFVSHWMQPHQPFRSRPEWWTGDGNLANLVNPDWEADICVWQETRRGRFDEDEVWAAYRDNLRWALDELERVLNNVDADVLITADHGNAMGERLTWGHPPGATSRAVRMVPDVVVRGADERTWVPRPLTATEKSAASSVEERLEALGYA